jgi:hypothetical protein
MQVDIRELRGRYASLSDDELMNIDAADLTEAARECYLAEVKNRHLKDKPAPRHEETGEVEAMEVEADWLDHAAVACSYTAVPGSEAAEDAARAQDALLACGVPCQLSVLEGDPGAKDASRYDQYNVMVPGALTLQAASVLDKEVFNEDLERDWRNHLAALTDQELRAMKPDEICAGLLDRVDRLTRAYQDEVDRRKAK